MPENESLAVRLAEIERQARVSTNVPASFALELIDTLRIYMALAEETNRRVVAMSEKLGGC